MSPFWIFWLPRQELHIVWQESKFFSNQMNQTKHFISRCNPSPFHSLSLLLLLLIHLFLLKSSAELFGSFSFFFRLLCNYSHSTDTKIWKCSKRSVCNKMVLLLYVSLTLTGLFFFLWRRLCWDLFFSYWSRLRERNRCILYKTMIQHCTVGDSTELFAYALCCPLFKCKSPRGHMIFTISVRKSWNFTSQVTKSLRCEFINSGIAVFHRWLATTWCKNLYIVWCEKWILLVNVMSCWHCSHRWLCC